MKKILLTGGSGFLGSRILSYFGEKKEYAPLAPDRRKLDISKREEVELAVGRFRPDIILHCGAISDTGYCQKHPEESYLINVMATRYLAAAAREVGAEFIFMSSDQIYNGNTLGRKNIPNGSRGELMKNNSNESRGELMKNNPNGSRGELMKNIPNGSRGELMKNTPNESRKDIIVFTKEDRNREREDDNPINIYGKHKKEGEELLFGIHPGAKALRLTWMYDYPRKDVKNNRNLITNLMAAGESRRPLSFACNEYRGITNVWEVVENLEKVFFIPPGIYNFGSENSLSTLVLAKKAGELLGIDPSLIEEDRLRFAKGPRNLSISTDKIKKEGIFFLESFIGLEKSIFLA